MAEARGVELVAAAGPVVDNGVRVQASVIADDFETEST